MKRISNHVWPWSNADFLTFADCEPSNSQKILSEQQKKKLAPLLTIILTSQQFYLFDVKEALPQITFYTVPSLFFEMVSLIQTTEGSQGKFLNQLGQP